MVNYYNSKDVESNFNSSNEVNKKAGFNRAFTSLFGKFKCMALIMFMLLAFSQLSWAQSTVNYAFTTNTTGSLALDANANAVDMSVGTTQLVAADLDDSASLVTNIGFSFYMYGNLFSQFSTSSNGVIQLGGTQVGTTTYVLSGGSTTTPRIGALAADLRTGISGKVHYKVVGTAPNRCLVIEFSNMSITFVGSPGSNDGTYQVRLYESSGIIEYVYGSMFRNASTTTTAAIYSGFSVGSAINTTASITTSTNTVSNGAAFNVNSYTASTNIANLHSTVDGSRRIYKFTPPVPAAGPTSLIVSGATSSGMTLDWTAAAPTTNIVKYIVFNSTNGGATYNFVANVLLGTNTYVATLLMPSTTYDWKVVAVSEGVESTSITGTLATTAASTYYWVGTTGGNWNTPANWNTAADNTGSTRTVVTTSDVLIVDGDGTTAGGSTTINVDLASFTIGQLIVNSNTNLTLQSSIATTRTISINGAPNDDFVIEAGSTLNLTNATNAVAIAFSNTGNVGLIGGTLNIGGNVANTFNSTGGTSTLVTVGTTGIINNSFVGATGVTGSVATLSFLDGSAYNVSGATTGAPNVPLATWATNSTLTISGLTTSTAGPTNNNQSFGNIVYNCPASSATWNMFGATTTAVVKGNLTILATGTGQFRTVSSGTLNVNGNIIVNSGATLSGHTTGTTIANGNTTINTGGTLRLDGGAGTFRQQGSTLTNNGTIMGTGSATAHNLFFLSFTDNPITFTGSGIVFPAINSISLQTLGGLTITHTNQIPVLRANLFYGNITGSNKLTFGTGLALTCTVQVGSAGNINPAGILLSQPTWNLGTGLLNLLYAQGTLPYTTGFEVPPTRTVNNLSLINTNGLTLSGGPLEVSGGLTLTAGNFTTSAANLLSLGTATVAGTLTGGSATSYVNGPFARTIATANANTNYILFPVGKTAYAPVSLAPSTTSVSVMKAEAFDSNSGTANAAIASLSANRRWETPLVSGTITDINVRLGDANLVNGNIPVQAIAAAGEYTSSFGSTATFAVGTPNTIQSNATALSANYTGFLSYAVSNACSGTPTPGATTATATTVCFGGSTTLGITSNPVGSGVTYQWQSSADGISYSDIVGATALTYLATPTQAIYYQCIVTCATGPASGTSTPIQITFTNSVTGATSATRCGTGTVTLGATPNSGASINWFANALGGASLASGTSFVTPSISSNTTYYAAATTSSPASATIGTATTLTGATAQPTAFCNRWSNYWSQTIYTAAELNAAGYSAGNITSMSYNITSLGDGATNPNFTVKIGTVAGTSFASTTFLSTATYTTVYGPSTYTHTASGLQTITFAAPYVWDGVSNIVVNVTHDGANATNNSQTYYTATADNKVLWATSFSGSTTTGTTSLNRLNVVFSGQAICESPRVPVLATVTAPPVFTLSTSAAAICAGDSSSPVTITAGAGDYDTYVWTPLTGVSGNSVTGWTFNPSATTSYTLTASQSGGALCEITAAVNITVNPKPTAITITPSPASTCVNSIQSLVATGGTINSIGSTPIGTATTLTTDNGTEPTAFNNRYEHYWMQMVFTAAELNAAGILAGNINGVKFNITTIGSAPNVTDFRVFMGNTALSTLTGFVPSGLSQVYATPTYTQAIGVNSIVFNTPYIWDGTSNIIVDIRSTGVDLALNASTYYTATPDNKTVSAVTSTTFPNSNAYVASNPAGTLSLKRLNTTFDWSSAVATPITWSPITDLYTDAAATVAYVGGTNASTVYVKSATAATTTYTATATAPVTGCETTATVDVTVTANSSLPNEVVSVCDTYTWAANGTTYTTSGIYTSTTSCVTRTLDLTITPSSSLPNEVVSVCDTYTWAANGTTYTASGIYTSTTSCVTRTLDLTITPSSSLPNEVVSVCDTYTWAANGTTYTTSGIYTSTTSCVTRTLDLTITSATISGATTQVINGGVAADATIEDIVVTSNGTVTWFASSADATANTNPLAVGTQLVDGNIYYGVTNIGTCRSTTLAVTVTVVLGTSSFDLSQLNYYPNPVKDIFNVKYNKEIISVDVYDLTGRKVIEMKPNTLEVQLNMTNLSNAMYIVRLQSVDGITELKVYKN